MPRLTRLAAAAACLLPLALGQAVDTGTDAEALLDCPDANVTDFAVKMLDGLSANGLLTFESLIVGISGGEGGYDLFASLAEYTAAYDEAADKAGDRGYTLLVPSDAAFEAAGYGNGGNWQADAAAQAEGEQGEKESDGKWGKLSEREALDLFKLHIVHGQWDAGKLPERGRNAIAPSLYQPHAGEKGSLLKRAMDDIELQRRQSPDRMTPESSTRAQSQNQSQGQGQSPTQGQTQGQQQPPANQARNVGTVIRKAESGDGVIIKTASGDVSSWSQLPDMKWTGLKGWKLIPIDFVLKFPPNISTALTLPTTTRSPNGLGQMAEAIEQVAEGAAGGGDEVAVKVKAKARRSVHVDGQEEDIRPLSAFDRAHQVVTRQTKQKGGHGADALAQLTTGGLTFFAPVDDAWNDAAWAQVGEVKTGPRLLGNHYTNNETLFSTAWYNKNASLNVMTGQTLNMWYDTESRAHKLRMGDQVATILRPDVVLENGVLHIIDKVLLVPSGAEDQPLRSLEPAEPTARAGTSGTSTDNGSGTSGASVTGKSKPGVESAATKIGMVGKGVVVQVTVLAVVVGAVMILVE